MTRSEIFNRIREDLLRLKKENSHFNRDDKVIEDLIKNIRSLCKRWPVMYVPGFTAISYKTRDTLDLLEVIDNDLVMGFKPEPGKSNQWINIACELLGLWYDELYREFWIPDILYKIKSDYEAYRKRRDPEYGRLRLPKQKEPKVMTNDELTKKLLSFKDTCNERNKLENDMYRYLTERIEKIENYINSKDAESKLGMEYKYDDETDC